VNHRKRHRFEEIDTFAGKDGNPMCRWEIAWGPEKLLDPVQVASDLVRRRALKTETRQPLNGGLHSILQLDKVLPTGPIPWLQLEVARDYAMGSRLNPGE
jgi:hypothetical protein